MLQLHKDWDLTIELHKWLNSQIKKEFPKDYDKGYNDAILDVKNKIETIIKNIPQQSQKLTST